MSVAWEYGVNNVLELFLLVYVKLLSLDMTGGVLWAWCTLFKKIKKLRTKFFFIPLGPAILKCLPTLKAKSTFFGSKKNNYTLLNKENKWIKSYLSANCLKSNAENIKMKWAMDFIILWENKSTLILKISWIYMNLKIMQIK